jgi:hypothetical protein
VLTQETVDAVLTVRCDDFRCGTLAINSVVLFGRFGIALRWFGDRDRAV